MGISSRGVSGGSYPEGSFCPGGSLSMEKMVQRFGVGV